MIIRQILAFVILSVLINSWFFWIIFKSWKDSRRHRVIKDLLLGLLMILGCFIILIRLNATINAPCVIVVKDTDNGVDYNSYFCVGRHSFNDGIQIEGIWGKTDIVNLSSSPLIYYPVNYSSFSTKTEEAYDRMRKIAKRVSELNGENNKDFPGDLIQPSHALKVDNKPYYIFEHPSENIESNSNFETRYALHVLPKYGVR